METVRFGRNTFSDVNLYISYLNDVSLLPHRSLARHLVRRKLRQLIHNHLFRDFSVVLGVYNVE